jgi:hypothetical protein
MFGNQLRIHAAYSEVMVLPRAASTTRGGRTWSPCKNYKTGISGHRNQWPGHREVSTFQELLGNQALPLPYGTSIAVSCKLPV